MKLRTFSQLAIAMVLVPSLAAFQPQPAAARLPFGAGERLTYNVNAGPGMNGRAEMWVGGPTDVAGASTLVLHSDISGGIGPMKVRDNTTSWLDSDRIASVRFQKEERHPFGKKNSEDVTMTAGSREWIAVDGRTGTSLHDEPLDELSFIYVLRTMDLPEDSTVVLNRHYDAKRNPTKLRSAGRKTIEIDGQDWKVVEIEMRVRDERRYRGEGILRIALSDDACRRPIRIESRIPNAGRVVMTLKSAMPVLESCGR